MHYLAIPRIHPRPGSTPKGEQGGLDKQFLLSQQFKYSSYYPRLFEAAFAKK